jgi:hypothetical protein
VDSIGEYLSNALHQVLAEQGALAQFSCHDAHAKNGVVENKHYILETTCALMLASSVPPHFGSSLLKLTLI